MTIRPGTRFSAYEISESIGAGGMGEVYRATDTNLKRDVAIKVLPESFAAQESRLLRFQREAEVLASLNHPNIGNIYGLERSDNTIALVLELVDGPTLEDRIAEGALPADEALDIAMQITDALEAAHGQGIVHRDLKPANIKLRPDGTVKVLDFGIAKALETHQTTGPGAPPLTTPTMTQAGLVLGTAQYMSPEQARGQAVDQRADIWAFGCLLYEMLTGQPAFGGEDVTVTLARILERDADTGSLPDALSPVVKQTITACLQKEPNKRIADIRDVRLALEGAFVPDDISVATLATATQSPFRRRLPNVVMLGIGAFIASLVAWSLWPMPESSPINRFDYDLPAGHALRATGRPVFAASRDGRQLVYNTRDGLYLRSMDELEARLIPGTEANLTTPIFSPNGQELLYWAFATNEIRRIATTGGATTRVASGVENPLGISWNPDGTILVGQPDGIYRVRATDATLELLIPTESPQIMVFGPELLPDGDSVLFTLTPDLFAWDDAQIVVQSLSTGARITIAEEGTDAHYLPSDHIVYASEDALFAIAFDIERLAVSGNPVPVLQAGLMQATANLTGATNYAVADDGSLMYLTGQRATQLRTLVWRDPEGREETTDVPPHNYTSVRLSPEDDRAALDTFDENTDIWIWDFAREPQRLTAGRAFNNSPVWWPDGLRVAWARAQGGTMQEIFWQTASGTGSPQALTDTDLLALNPTDITQDGYVLFSEFVPPQNIWMASLEGPIRDAEALLATDADESNATVSPDGNWLAYESNESGRAEIYVAPFPDPESDRHQVSSGGGTRPVWSSGGSRLYYYVDRGSAGAFMAVDLEFEPTLTPSLPVQLFEGPYFPPLGIVAPSPAFYDVADDERFLIIKDIAGERTEDTFVRPPQVIIVQNWVHELQRLVPTN